MINKNNLLTGKAGISYIEIVLLVTSLFAISYIFYQVSDTVSEKGVSTGIEMVDAAGSVCCEETISGNSCQMTTSEQCNPAFTISPTDCVATNFCEIGCCISENTGLCNMATSRRDCEKINGTFSSGAACNIPECKKGCCILGNQAKWTTEQNCKFEGNTEHEDSLTEWRFDENSDTELECLFNVEKDKEGACVFDSENENGDIEKKCVFTTLGECVSRTGSEAHFNHEGKFCSDPALNTTCKTKDHKGCVDNEEDVYWFDSCGNKEEVADDCDLFNGNYCREKDDVVECREVDCDIDGDGSIDRKNGESWCTYDGKIGDGKDPAGSRHVKHICYFGTERLSPCADFRNEICVQEDAAVDGGTFSQAACRVNQWRTCLSYNREGGVDSMVSKCTQNPDCRVKHIDMAGSFNFQVCLPNYPPGFELNFEQDILSDDQTLSPDYYRVSSADGICSAATQRCTQTWYCCILGCVCVDNCKCSTEYFTSEMNDFCTSLGDCGAYINYVGEFSDGGYSVKGAPRIGNSFSKYAGPQAGQKPASPGNADFFQSIDPSLLPEVAKESSNLSAFEQELMTASGAYGSPLLLKILTAENDSSVFGNLDALSAGATGLSQFTSAVSSIQAAIDSQIETDDKGEPPDLSMLVAMLAALIAYVITQSVMAAMVAALLGFLFALCWVVYVDIDFTCMPWQPPDGGEKCNKCNTLEVPCTEYRCESLGSLCQLINKGTGNELCISRPANETLPKISVFENAISSGYAYKNIDENGFDVVNATTGECIEPYTSVDIGIKVDPFARCRIGNNSDDGYDDMSAVFGAKGNYILPAHVTTLFFPNPEAFKNVYNLTDAQVEALGTWDLYVKCKTASGKINPEPYNIHTCIKPGPDLTPPRITSVQPASGDFVNFGAEEKEIIVYVNEPSECKWSDHDIGYDEMNNSLACNTNLMSFTQFGWKCTTTLTGLKNNTRFFVKCQDQPWLAVEERNTMSESFFYELKTSLYPLVIDEIIPKYDEMIISGVEPVSVKLRAKTSGGALKGESICRWEGNGYGDSFSYRGNGSTKHEYTLNLHEGTYTINLFCEDAAKNTAQNATRFTIAIDKFGPKVTRIYYDFGLKVITNEKSECKYSFNRNFEYTNATKMSGDNRDHFAPWLLKTYYVQCKDSYGNKGTIIKVMPTGL